MRQHQVVQRKGSVEVAVHQTARQPRDAVAAGVYLADIARVAFIAEEKHPVEPAHITYYTHASPLGE